MGIIFLIPEIVITALFSLLVCQFPWTGQFSFEYSLILTVFFFFLVTVSGSARLRDSTLNKIQKNQWLGRYAFLLLIPLFVVLMYSLKHGLCSFTSGLQWYIWLPTITLLFSYACVIHSVREKKSFCKTLLTSWLPAIAFSIITLHDLYVDPQLSFYHPVLGYFPGPVYDEWIPRFDALFTYRIWIVLLSLCLIFTDWKSKKNNPLALGVLIFGLIFQKELGWHESHRTIQKKLGQHISSASSDIYFSPISSNNMDEFAKKIDEQIKNIQAILHIQPSNQKIRVYVYPDAITKKEWTGTQYTLIGNPMQRSIHLLPTDANDSILIHELTHVVAASMGMPIFKISPKIGLLEGLATAMQKEDLGLSIHEWARTMQMTNQLPDLSKTMNALSFWKENPTKVYLASGSFVQWLIDIHGIEKFKQVYRGVTFDKVYGSPISILIEDWKKFIEPMVVDEEKVKKARMYLEAKPFYQKPCVHEVADQRMKCKSTVKTMRSSCRI